MGETSGRRNSGVWAAAWQGALYVYGGCMALPTHGYPVCAPPLDVRPGWTEARFCFLTSFACRSSSGSRLVLDEGSVRLRVTVTIEFDREGGVSTTGDRLPPSIGDFSVYSHAGVRSAVG